MAEKEGEFGERARAKLDARPVLPNYLVKYFEAFQRLTNDRAMGFTQPGHIPWTAINEYGYRYGFEDEDFDRLVHFVEALDKVYLQNLPKDGNGGGPPRGRGKNVKKPSQRNF